MAALGNRCCFLNADGFRCVNTALGVFTYHGENEIYSDVFNQDLASWVCVPLCPRHSSALPKESRYIEAVMKREYRERRAKLKEAYARAVHTWGSCRDGRDPDLCDACERSEKVK